MSGPGVQPLPGPLFENKTGNPPVPPSQMKTDCNVIEDIYDGTFWTCNMDRIRTREASHVSCHTGVPQIYMRTAGLWEMANCTSPSLALKPDRKPTRSPHPNENGGLYIYICMTKEACWVHMQSAQECKKSAQHAS